MSEFVIELTKQYPSAFPWLLVAFFGLGAWHMGMTWSTFRYMKSSMVTKKDLQIALLQAAMEMDERYVKREDCPKEYK